ncbi:MAG TPA: hypothetical protein PLQ93_03980 [Bacteroidia bacterium]|nr:hypothetical protein [Bacteroidia bacterium]
MKQINYKKIIRLFTWILVLGTLLFSLGFVSGKESHIVARTLNIDILNNDENPFLNENDVKQFFESRNDKILGEEYSRLRIPELEKALNTHPAIEEAEVSAKLNGEVQVEIKQRTPLLRVINKSGESYYIDTRAKLMPLNENYTARVLVASGEIDEPFDRRASFSVDQIASNEIFSKISLLDDLLETARAITADSVLNALIHQIYVNQNKELELFPVIGCQRIILGDASALHEKLAELKLFYREGLNKTNGWQKYSAINLKYRNMVVCTKK